MRHERDFARELADAISDQIIECHKAMERPHDLAGYSRWSGQVAGLRWVETTISEILKKHTKEDG